MNKTGRYEYKIYGIKIGSSNKELEKYMNDLANEGWENYALYWKEPTTKEEIENTKVWHKNIGMSHDEIDSLKFDKVGKVNMLWRRLK